MPEGRIARHETCRHKEYRFTCDEYEQLMDRASGRCEICTTPLSYRISQCIQIDHDHSIAKWAVRGILCQACNSYGLPHREPTEATLHYLQNPWYMTLIAAAGTTLAGPPEPSPEMLVRDRIGGRLWRFQSEGWTASSRDPRSWTAVVAEVGPHNVTVFEAPRRTNQVVSVRVDSAQAAARTLHRQLSTDHRRELALLLLDQ